MSKNEHAAIESNLGYYYQAFYGLVVLLKSNDESTISLETYDDIYLEQGDMPSLYQIKHKSKGIKQLNIKSDDLWKTLLIWSKTKNKSTSKFILVTCDFIDKNDILNELTKDIRNISQLKLQLLEEANRVIKEREEYEKNVSLGLIKKQKLPPYENKISGCKAICNLDSTDLEILLNNVYILHKEFKIFDLEEKIGQLISIIVPRRMRENMVKRLIEWWSYRVVKSMMNINFRDITKSELQIKLTELIGELREERFYIDNLNFKPSNAEAREHEKKSINLIKQIDIINGGEIRKKKALVNCWKARKQRDEWIADDISNAFELEQYDETLIEAWEYRFGIMKEKEMDETEKKEHGLKLYDWSNDEAKNEIDVMYEKLKTGFIVHGTYQSLADQLKVGWHSDFEEIIGDDGEDGEDGKC